MLSGRSWTFRVLLEGLSKMAQPLNSKVITSLVTALGSFMAVPGCSQDVPVQALDSSEGSVELSGGPWD